MHGPPFGPPPIDGPPWEVLEQLNLATAQRAKVKSLRGESERQSIRVEADLRIAELELRELLEADAPDPPAIDAAIEQVGSMRMQMHKLRIKTWLAVRSTLTAEQRAKLRDLARAAPRGRGGRPDALRSPPDHSRY